MEKVSNALIVPVNTAPVSTELNDGDAQSQNTSLSGAPVASSTEEATHKRPRITNLQEKNFHDRCIKTDTGWTITLGRGLDMFEKYSPYSIEALRQDKRKCKEFMVTFMKTKNA